MAIVPFGAGAGPNPLWLLTGALIQFAVGFVRSKLVQGGAVGVGGVQLLDALRTQSIALAPGSDREALEEVARFVMRCVGEGAVFWPRDSFSGEPIPPMFMVIDFNKGSAYFRRTNPARRRIGPRYRRRYGRLPWGLMRRRFGR